MLYEYFNRFFKKNAWDYISDVPYGLGRVTFNFQ